MQFSNSVIEYNDLGSLDVPSLSQARWLPIIVKNQEFIYTNLKGSIALNENKIMIFGSSFNKCFFMDTEVLN